MNTFQFDKIRDFDKHISLSIPNYEYMCNQVKMFTEAFSEPNSVIVDVGCSTGKFINELDVDWSVDCYGVDSSDLIEGVIQNRTQNKIFCKADFLTWSMPENCSVVTSMFFLQFLGYHDRINALNKIANSLNPDGRMIICEKTYFHDLRIEHIVTAHHLEEKRNHFTDTEILDKNIQLSNSMKLRTDEELIEELGAFGDVSVFFKSLGFTGCIVKI